MDEIRWCYVNQCWQFYLFDIIMPTKCIDLLLPLKLAFSNNLKELEVADKSEFGDFFECETERRLLYGTNIYLESRIFHIGTN